MHRLEDLAPASWLGGTGAEPMGLLTLGPAGFEAYARLRFIPDPDGPGRSEADVVVPEDHPSDLAQARTALHVLAGHTRTAEACYFCVWEGWAGSSLDAGLLGGPLVVLPHRQYVLFAGSLGDIDRWEEEFGGGRPCPPPAFVWPADRAWCFTSDVDPHWAGIGGSAAAVGALVARSDVDAVRTSPGEAQPFYDG